MLLLGANRSLGATREIQGCSLTCYLAMIPVKTIAVMLVMIAKP